MLKKNLWIVVLLAALAIVITGCPEGSLAGSKSLIPIPTYWDDPAFRPGAPKPPPDPISVTFAASGANTTQVVTPPGGWGTPTYVGTDGYKYTYADGKGHGNGVASFKLNLGDYAIKDFEKVELKLKLVGGDVGDDFTTGPTPQTINLLASATQFAGWLSDGVVIASTASVRNSVADSAIGINQNGAEIGNGVTTVKELEIDLGTTNPVSNLSGEVWFAFYIHAADVGAMGGAGTTTAYEISGVTFVPRTSGPAHVPITSLTFTGGLTGYVGIPKTLDASINPASATAYGTPISWSIVSAGTTGITAITSGQVTATAIGTATFRATVPNGGATAGANYTQDFEIEFEVTDEFITVMVNGVGQERQVSTVSGTVAYDVTNGYRFTRGAAWQGSYAYFLVDLGAGKTLKDYKQIKLKYAGVSGDIGSKGLNAIASATPFAGNIVEGNAINIPGISVTGTTETNITFDIDQGKLEDLSIDTQREVYISIFFNARMDASSLDPTLTVHTIKDVEFVIGDPATITFNTSPGNPLASVIRHKGSKAGTLPEATRTGYAFTGWLDTSDSDAPVTVHTLITADVTYDATWALLPTADLTYSDFTNVGPIYNPSDGGYGQSYNSGNEWTVSGSYQRVKFTLTDTVSAVMYPQMIIDVATADFACRLRFLNSTGADILNGQNGLTITPGTPQRIVTPNGTKFLAFEIAGDGTMVININSVTLVCPNNVVPIP